MAPVASLVLTLDGDLHRHAVDGLLVRDVFPRGFVEFHFAPILADHLLAGSSGFGKVLGTQIGALFESRASLLKTSKFLRRLLVAGFRQMLCHNTTSITPFSR